jgi:hypothetical protein
MHPMAASAHRQACQKLAASTLRNLPRATSRLPTAHFGLVLRRDAFSSSSTSRFWSRQQSAKPATVATPTKLPSSLATRRSYSSGSPPPPPPKSGNNIKFWPFVAVIALGSGGYMLLVNRRKGALEPGKFVWMGASSSTKPEVKEGAESIMGPNFRPPGAHHRMETRPITSSRFSNPSPTPNIPSPYPLLPLISALTTQYTAPPTNKLGS